MIKIPANILTFTFIFTMYISFIFQKFSMAEKIAEIDNLVCPLFLQIASFVKNNVTISIGRKETKQSFYFFGCGR
jgi:hypothetical protein